MFCLRLPACRRSRFPSQQGSANARMGDQIAVSIIGRDPVRTTPFFLLPAVCSAGPAGRIPDFQAVAGGGQTAPSGDPLL